MFPVLLEIGPLRVPAYGTVLVVAFALGTLLSCGLARRSGVSARSVAELCSVLVIGGGFGSRLFFVLVNAGEWDGDPWGPLRLWDGGAVWYGGVIGGGVALALVGPRIGLDASRLGDLLAPGIAAAHATGRVGCFLAGCCWGRETSVGWAVSFPANSLCGTPGRWIHPTQLYEATAEAMCAGVLFALWRRKLPPGTVFFSYLALYSSIRIAVEFFRGDIDRGFVIPGLLSIAQAISIVVLTVASRAVLRIYRSHNCVQSRM